MYHFTNFRLPICTVKSIICHWISTGTNLELAEHHGHYSLLFRGGAEERIRAKLLKDGNIDTMIGLSSNLFFSTGIPVCILMLKKCKKPDDVLFINASSSEHFEKGKRQNSLRPEHIEKIVATYQCRKEEDRHSRRVSMEEIAQNDYNLNISRYVSTAKSEEVIDLKAVNEELRAIERRAEEARERQLKRIHRILGGVFYGRGIFDPGMEGGDTKFFCLSMKILRRNISLILT